MTDGNGVTENTTQDTFGSVAGMAYSNATGAIDSFGYTYDVDGNVLSQRNNVITSQSELYSYDGLNRLETFSRGTSNADGTAITCSTASQSRSLDALGNWDSSTTDGTTTRGNDAQNQATQVGSATLDYYADGNTTTEQTGQQYVYDAWNRLVAVKNAGGTTIASYQYDPTGRRTVETESGTTTDLYNRTAENYRTMSTAGSPYVGVFVTPTGGVTFHYRTTAGGSIKPPHQSAGATAAHPIRQQRQRLLQHRRHYLASDRRDHDRSIGRERNGRDGCFVREQSLTATATFSNVSLT